MIYIAFATFMNVWMMHGGPFLGKLGHSSVQSKSHATLSIDLGIPDKGWTLT